MKLFVLLSLLASAAAFTSPLSFPKSTTQLKGVKDMVGVSHEFGNRVFDPLGFSNYASDSTLAWFRHAELKHGRAAMLASLGWMVQKNGLGIIPFPEGASFAESGKTHLLSSDPFTAAHELPAGGWWQMFFVAGCIELWTESKGTHYMKSGSYTAITEFGGANFPADEKMQLKELKNGRLAMIASMAYLAHEINPAFVPLPMP
ncbi:hypothetical protein TrVE_jg3681 [Triparma verrucosa]|uniref:Chlorophyll a-b binding protein, chloroplastic n=2 Tax=Triparma TaxID=722752 RepID=A0A9W7C1B4_9STRA|nr:hypothetical protein TrST_g12864 [Triparma strigata]GMI14124.1 hypothetical protein TrVE_jg3681 [Triparma verrucosa]|mmetsp:Transcript_7917/g.14312  ORF Transcript_7917/g.14312 Transcript_7917/m.14312 type:complete len:203 (+) Transcript_7917:38-646(+)|eukprot:CAMPEP_0182491812 /NCGR_PEP_ID=MMETSP1321-20130603/1121_1 /TAXON_ID=91990 /ORGANISM="Bolidomonas sp., Strain RCC1657" /LENGTH=202 /DNA_ID=CAMNT_0024694147 /DNA_START=32 /DNA_END=640 /DNA_ORIENTATION=-